MSCARAGFAKAMHTQTTAGGCPAGRTSGEVRCCGEGATARPGCGMATVCPERTRWRRLPPVKMRAKLLVMWQTECDHSFHTCRRLCRDDQIGYRSRRMRGRCSFPRNGLARPLRSCAAGRIAWRSRACPRRHSPTRGWAERATTTQLTSGEQASCGAFYITEIRMRLTQAASATSPCD